MKYEKMMSSSQKKSMVKDLLQNLDYQSLLELKMNLNKHLNDQSVESLLANSQIHLKTDGPDQYPKNLNRHID